MMNLFKVMPLFLVVFFVGCTTFPQEVAEPIIKIGSDIKEVHEVAKPVIEVAIVQAEKAVEKMEDEEKKAEYVAKIEKMKKVLKTIDSAVEKIDKVIAIIKNYQELATKEEEAPKVEPPVEPVTP